MSRNSWTRLRRLSVSEWALLLEALLLLPLTALALRLFGYGWVRSRLLAFPMNTATDIASSANARVSAKTETATSNLTAAASAVAASISIETVCLAGALAQALRARHATAAALT